MAEEIPMVTSPTNVSGKKAKPGVNYKRDQEGLLKCLEDENICGFEDLLKHKDEYNIKPDHVYGGKCNKTCLAEASRRGLTEFIDALLKNDADPNVVSILHSGRAAIHFAADEGHIDAIKCLVKHPNTQINAIDRLGNTALHVLAANLTKGKNAEECFSYLASLEKTNVRHWNAEGKSAISMAVGKFSGGIWQKLLGRQSLRPEDRQLILEKHLECQKDNKVITEPIYTHDDAYSYLRNKNCGRFKNEFKEEFVNRIDLIETTFLQLACKEGYPDIVENLLGCGADVNKTGTHEKRPPVYLACYCGQFDILKQLFETKKIDVGFVEGRSLFHSVIEGLGGNATPTDGYRKCFDYLLNNKELKTLINHADKFGHTALHYAAYEESGYYTKSLLEHGAYIGYLNEFGFSPLHVIGPQVLEEILDNCVECKKTNMDNQYELTFNFNMLDPNEKFDTTEQTKDPESGKGHQESLPEMSPLYFISRSNKFERLLKHPVLLIFLHLKWTRIRMWFYINMIYYITFVIFLTANILTGSYSSGKYCVSSEPSVVWVILLVLTVILVVREIIQFCLLPNKWRYFCKLDNILEVCIITTTIVTLVGTCSKILIAVTLLLSWMEVILQLGCIYDLAVYNEMMKRVTLNYVKFLSWYLPLILAFSFSFHIIYSKGNNFEGKNGTFYVNGASGDFSVEDDNLFRNLNTSLLKTVVMMVGEFDASNMSFDYGSYFVFLFFVFMMTIVLTNLLNGLAVSDTQAIKNDAELVAYRSKVKLVHHFESVVFSGRLKDRCNCHLNGGSPSLCYPWQRSLQKAISLFPDAFEKGNLKLELNHGTRYTNLWMNKTDEEFRAGTCCRIGNLRMELEVDPEVLIAAKDIADKRTKQSQHEKNEIVSRVAKVEEDLQGCMKQLANIQELLQQLINNR